MGAASWTTGRAKSHELLDAIDEARTPLARAKARRGQLEVILEHCRELYLVLDGLEEGPPSADVQPQLLRTLNATAEAVRNLGGRLELLVATMTHMNSKHDVRAQADLEELLVVRRDAVLDEMKSCVRQVKEFLSLAKNVPLRIVSRRTTVRSRIVAEGEREVG